MINGCTSYATQMLPIPSQVLVGFRWNLNQSTHLERFCYFVFRSKPIGCCAEPENGEKWKARSHPLWTESALERFALADYFQKTLDRAIKELSHANFPTDWKNSGTCRWRSLRACWIINEASRPPATGGQKLTTMRPLTANYCVVGTRWTCSLSN